jgi:hypothetical protein
MTSETRLKENGMTPQDAAARFHELRTDAGPIDVAVLDAVWAGLATVAAEDILGPWRGFGFETGHPVGQLLDVGRWHGKRFDSLDDAKPLICRAEDGSLFSDVKSGRGEASLWNIAFRGEVTATMVYDGMPVFDHFKRVDDRTLMGIMNGKAAHVRDAAGQHFYFGLERE